MPWKVAMAIALVYILIPSVASEELNRVLMTCSPKCQYTATNCVLQSRTASGDANAGRYCRLFQRSDDVLTAYQCLVRLGLCTDDEYDKLEAAACGGATRKRNGADEARKLFYSAVDSIGEFCQKEFVRCVRASSVATVYKQHGRFCYLMGLSLDNFNFRTCLLRNNQCVHSEYARMNDSACMRSARKAASSEFFDALLLTSPTCRNGLDHCSISSIKALELIQAERYCEALHVEEDGKSAYGCLVESNRCEQKEYDKLKDAVCGGGRPALALGTIISCLLFFLLITSRFSFH
ncbi:unnamed protein product [Lymnaea stagnalis]|uniref:Secreted protein n=1 Tax=Lymnaea stagnalis TaxID=6523 RepID=A0AAV2ICF3_LYMST